MFDWYLREGLLAGMFKEIDRGWEDEAWKNFPNNIIVHGDKDSLLAIIINTIRTDINIFTIFTLYLFSFINNFTRIIVFFKETWSSPEPHFNYPYN